MRAFIGAKIILAEPMDENTFISKYKHKETENSEIKLGYHVIYPDAFHSWSPKDVFENAYREITSGEFRMVDNVRTEGSDSSVK